MAVKTRTIQVGSAEVAVDASKQISEVVSDQARAAGYNTFWVFMEEAGKRREVREGDVKGKSLSDIAENVKLVIEKFDEGG